MHRGNPSLTGVVQSSGLRRFQQVKWELEGQFAVHLPLVAGHDLIYATWLTGMHVEIHAMEKATGTVQWLWKPGQNEYAGQAHLHLDQGMLYYPVYAVQAQPGTHVALLREAFLSAFDAQTGQVLRHIPIPPLGNRLMGKLFTMHEGVVYLNGMDSAPSPSAHYSCAAVDLQTEKLLWMTDMGVRLYSTSPVVAHGMVYLQTYDAARGRQSLMHLHALNAQTGAHVWEYECERGLVRDFAVAGTDIFVISGGLEVIDALRGTRKWHLPFQRSALNGPPTITDEFIYLSYEGFPTWIEGKPHQTGEMVVLERASRQQQWSAKADEGQSGTEGAIVAGELLYAVWEQFDARPAVINATLFALDLGTGQEYWRFDATELSVPLVTDGNVFLVRGQGEGMSTFLCALT